MNDTNGTPMNVDSELYPALIQCFFIIGAGYVAGQLNLVTKSQSAGLSRFMSHFALPAIIFKNLVDIQFQSVSWQFLASVLIAKTIVFVCTAILTAIGERPKNFASMGLYAIMTTQTNDFALIGPIIEAIFKESHPDFERYVYLIAPISLVILNPIGFFLIEIQNRLDDPRRRHPNTSKWQRLAVIKKIFFNISKNPIVICTLLGIIFNRIFNEHLPDILERVLTPIAESFTAVALFYLGLTMVGKLRHLHVHLVVTVLLLSIIKLILFPLLLRQIVFFLVKPINGTLNTTIDYSNLGFLYGTAPTAPSVLVYIPESSVTLQAIASTGLVLSTLLSGPIMFISAKMINLRTLDMKTTAAYELSLLKTAFDASMVSLFCTIIVLIGFCLRRHFVQTSFIHKYTFIFVGLQMIHAIWAISIQYIELPISESAEIVLTLGDMLTTLTIRSWITSLSIASMISFCYSTERARSYFWLYHLYGWLAPISTALIIYLKSQNEPLAGSANFGKIQTIASIVFLALCIIICSANLLRIARRAFKLKHNAGQSRRVSFSINEIRPLINDDSGIDQSQVTIQSISTDTESFEADTQLLRHAVLITAFDISAFICISVLSWSILVTNQDGVYYELQFLDTVLLHGQGIVTFLIFALDADLLVPIRRKFIKLLHCSGLRKKFSRNISQCSTQSTRSVDFEQTIRPDFIRYTFTTQNVNSATGAIETIFNGNDFCQWLVSAGHMENESKAQSYCQELVDNKQIICIDRSENATNHWYAFSK